VHVLRNRMGLDVVAFDAADDVGGTWYWNRYPGARVDIESVHYSYSFDDALQQEWRWSERFCAQPEILAYLGHVADRYELRPSIRFKTRITSLTWDDDASMWIATTDAGDSWRARYVVSGAGTLSVPKKPDFPGIDKFAGRVLMTGNWPHHEISFAGKRVGIIGVGSSGIQAISEIAKTAGHLTVFQRTPNYATPIGNTPLDPSEVADDKAHYKAIREASRKHFLGVPYRDVQPSALAVAPERRRAVFDDRWNRGGFRLFIDSFADILFDKKANDTAAEYIRERIRERVKDPATAALLSPTDYPYGTKRPPLETDYYEAYNRPNVTLLDVRTNGVKAITAKGVELADGSLHELDVLILATGFDACTGPLLAMNITGRNGLRLADHWADGPQTYLGLMAAGFPNLFMITGPQSPSVLYNMPLAIEDHVDLSCEAIAHLRQQGLDVIEPTSEAERAWVAHTNELAQATLLPESKTSWYMGNNISGKPRRVLVYLGGAPTYRAKCDAIVKAGWAGFSLTATERAQA
jgi:cation diffusion facilitator CzcD-associated flavoprotein CzcO